MNTCRKCGNQWEKGGFCPECGAPINEPPQYTSTAPDANQTGTSDFPVWAIPLIVIGILLILIVGGVILFIQSLRTTSDELRHSFENEYQDDYAPRFETDEDERLPQESRLPDPEQDRELTLDYQKEHGIFNGEFYEVGSEVPPGEYVVMSNGSAAAPDFHMAVYTSSSQSEESRLYGGWYSNCKYVILEEGQYVELTHAVLYDPVKNELPLDPFSADGMYKVGTDLAPGTYTVKSISDQYTGDLIIYSSINAIAPVTRDFEFVDTGESKEVTLAEGEYIEMRFCCLE